jgi:hypothetical protein
MVHMDIGPIAIMISLDGFYCSPGPSAHGFEFAVIQALTIVPQHFQMLLHQKREIIEALAYGWNHRAPRIGQRAGDRRQCDPSRGRCAVSKLCGFGAGRRAKRSKRTANGWDAERPPVR